MKLELTIGWLYPELMNIYGDRGNITCLTKRSAWRQIGVNVKKFDVGFSEEDLKSCDLLVMGGAQDRQQEAVSKDLFKKKNTLKKMIDSGVPGLYICGAYQFLGKYYKLEDGSIIDGLGILDLYTENPGNDSKRLIGNMAFKSDVIDYMIVGFENHGGRTYLGKNIKPFGKVIKGFGNNGKDNFEGAYYKESFATYSHGPILPKNPKFTDYLIEKALSRKYKREINLEKLDDSFEQEARLAIAKKLQIAI